MSGAGAASCTGCVVGHSSFPGSSSCAACRAGTFAGNGKPRCFPCNINTYSGAGAGVCAACNTNTYSQVGSATCTLTEPVCEDGYEYVSDECVPTGPGSGPPPAAPCGKTLKQRLDECSIAYTPYTGGLLDATKYFLRPRGMYNGKHIWAVENYSYSATKIVQIDEELPMITVPPRTVATFAHGVHPQTVLMYIQNGVGAGEYDDDDTIAAAYAPCDALTTACTSTGDCAATAWPEDNELCTCHQPVKYMLDIQAIAMIPFTGTYSTSLEFHPLGVYAGKAAWSIQNRWTSPMTLRIDDHTNFLLPARTEAMLLHGTHPTFASLKSEFGVVIDTDLSLGTAYSPCADVSLCAVIDCNPLPYGTHSGSNYHVGTDPTPENHAVDTSGYRMYLRCRQLTNGIVQNSHIYDISTGEKSYALVYASTDLTLHTNGAPLPPLSHLHIANNPSWTGTSHFALHALPANGWVDEVRLWNYAREEQLILEYADRPIFSTPPGLVFYHRFDIPIIMLPHNSYIVSSTAGPSMTINAPDEAPYFSFVEGHGHYQNSTLCGNAPAVFSSHSNHYALRLSNSPNAWMEVSYDPLPGTTAEFTVEVEIMMPTYTAGAKRFLHGEQLLPSHSGFECHLSHALHPGLAVIDCRRGHHGQHSSSTVCHIPDMRSKFGHLSIVSKTHHHYMGIYIYYNGIFVSDCQENFDTVTTLSNWHFHGANSLRYIVGKESENGLLLRRFLMWNHARTTSEIQADWHHLSPSNAMLQTGSSGLLTYISFDALIVPVYNTGTLKYNPFVVSSKTQPPDAIIHNDHGSAAYLAFIVSIMPSSLPVYITSTLSTQANLNAHSPALAIYEHSSHRFAAIWDALAPPKLEYTYAKKLTADRKMVVDKVSGGLLSIKIGCGEHHKYERSTDKCIADATPIPGSPTQLGASLPSPGNLSNDDTLQLTIIYGASTMAFMTVVGVGALGFYVWYRRYLRRKYPYDNL